MTSKARLPRAPEHLRFAVLATDVALFTISENNELLVRLITVNRPPHYPGVLGLPGGLLTEDETAEEAAKRFLCDRAFVNEKNVYLEQLYTFSRIDRDPRGRVVAVAYTGLIPWEKLSLPEQKSNELATWTPVKKVKKLAYDHDEILSVALARLRSRVSYTTLMAKCIGREFTLTELEEAYEAILGADLDKRNFRKKIQKLELLVPIRNKKRSGPFRPAQLYRFATKTVSEIPLL